MLHTRRNRTVRFPVSSTAEMTGRQEYQSAVLDQASSLTGLLTTLSRVNGNRLSCSLRSYKRLRSGMIWLDTSLTLLLLLLYLEIE